MTSLTENFRQKLLKKTFLRQGLTFCALNTVPTIRQCRHILLVFFPSPNGTGAVVRREMCFNMLKGTGGVSSQSSNCLLSFGVVVTEEKISRTNDRKNKHGIHSKNTLIDHRQHSSIGLLHTISRTTPHGESSIKTLPMTPWPAGSAGKVRTVTFGRH